MELTEIDLNLLVLFQRLMEEQHVSSVAEKMNVSQPGVSNALAKLRRRPDDPLFVRGPGGVVPTPFALRLAEPVAARWQRCRQRSIPARISTRCAPHVR